MNQAFRRVMRDITKATRKSGRSTLISLSAGYALGALTNIFPWPSFILFSSVLAVVIVMALINTIQSSRVRAFTPWELSLRDPDNDAAAAASRANERHLVVGQAIEIIPHPRLNSRSDFRKLGWLPEEVELIDQQTKFQAADLLAQVGGLRVFDPPNGAKYALISTSYVTSDSPRLELSAARTDYFTLRSILPAIQADTRLRQTYGRLEPSYNRIPHSLCLHYIVRFSNGDILCMRRDARAAYHGGRWSVSGEEQVSDEDFKFEKPCLALFQRAFCEEALPLRDDTPLDERWQIVAPLIETMRLWSVLLEEGIHNFSLLGFYQLNCDPDEFVATYAALIDKGIGTRDREGDFYVVDAGKALQLLVEGHCMARALFTDADMEVRAEYLHPTSRYRIFRLLRALKRGPLEIDDYQPSELLSHQLD